MPKPELNRFDSSTFGSLRGREFLEAVDVLTRLTTAKYTVQKPPEGVVELVEHSIMSSIYSPLEIGIDQAMLVRGEILEEFIDYAVESRIVPNRNTEEDGLLTSGFGIEVQFSDNPKEGHRALIKNKRKKPIQISHDHGSLNPYSREVRKAIAAIAVAPEELFAKIRNKGVVIGTVVGDYYNQPWTVVTKSVFVSDPEGHLSYRKDGSFLKNYPTNELQGRVDNSKSKDQIKDFLKNAGLVGIFADLRSEK